MKRILCLALAAATALTLVSCGKSSDGASSGSSSGASSAPTTSWDRMTIGGADSTGTMYAAAAAIAIEGAETINPAMSPETVRQRAGL